MHPEGEQGAARRGKDSRGAQQRREARHRRQPAAQERRQHDRQRQQRIGQPDVGWAILRRGEFQNDVQPGDAIAGGSGAEQDEAQEQPTLARRQQRVEACLLYTSRCV